MTFSRIGHGAVFQRADVAFGPVAASITDRWCTERDTWVSSSEVEEARAYLARCGVVTIALPDGHYRVEQRGEVVDATQLVVESLRCLVARTGRSPAQLR